MQLDKIKLNEDNPRKIDDCAFEKLKVSIETNPKFMEMRPIVIDENGIILGGNQRYKACLELYEETKEIPDNWVKQVIGLTDTQKKEFMLLDNSPKGYSGDWDIDLLKDVLLDLPEFDLLDDFGLIDYKDTDFSPPLTNTENNSQNPSYTFTIVCEDRKEWEELQTELNYQTEDDKARISFSKFKEIKL